MRSLGSSPTFAIFEAELRTCVRDLHQLSLFLRLNSAPAFGIFTNFRYF